MRLIRVARPVWLLMVAEQKTPGDSQVTDWGALVAAVSRHEAGMFGTPVWCATWPGW
jgi:hypothetical protein